MNSMAKAGNNGPISSAYPANYLFYSRHFNGPMTKEAFEGKISSILKTEWQGFSSTYDDVASKSKKFISLLEAKDDSNYPRALLHSASTLEIALSDLKNSVSEAHSSDRFREDMLVSACISSLTVNLVNSITPINSAVAYVEKRNDPKYVEIAKNSFRPLSRLQNFMKNPCDITVTFEEGRVQFISFNYPKE